MTEVLPAARDVGLTYTAREPDQLERSLASVGDAARFAEIIATTQFVPAGLRGKPDQILACFMLGRELGLGPMRSLSWIILVDGRPSVYAEGVRALILARGHELKTLDWNRTRCVLAGRRAGSSEWQEVTYTFDDAKQAGLTSKPTWRQYPADMLLARATARLSRLLFADVLAGLGTVEEYADFNGSTAPASPSQDAVEGGAGASPKPTRRRRRSPEPPPAAVAPASDSETLPDQTDEDTVETASPTSPEAEPDPEQEYEAEGARIENLLEEQREAEAIENERRLIADLEASGATLVDEAKAKADDPELITPEQRTKLHALFGEKEVTSREAKLAYVSRIAKRPIASSNELTVAEASLVIDALEQWQPYDPSTAPFPEGF